VPLRMVVHFPDRTKHEEQPERIQEGLE
jgi:hypothetical protein